MMISVWWLLLLIPVGVAGFVVGAAAVMQHVFGDS